jgi:dTDP-glucose pyrophosphorylase
MRAVVLAAGMGTRLRPLTDGKPNAVVEADGQPIRSHCFDELAALDAAGLLVVVRHRKEQIIDYYGDGCAGVPITYAAQAEQEGLVHAVLTAEDEVHDGFMLMLGDDVFDANLEDVVTRRKEDCREHRAKVEPTSNEVREAVE